MPPFSKRFASAPLTCRLNLAAIAAATLLMANAAEAAQVKPSEAPTEASSQKDSHEEEAPLGFWGRPVKRGGFHFQVGFGVGGGPDTLGIFHTMELGYSWRRSTVGLLHTFIQNKGALGTDLGGPDLIGGWMLEYKHTLFYPDLVGKVAVGLGGTHDQSDGIEAHGGFGASYGIDWLLPVTKRFGPSLTLAALHVTAEGSHHFGAGLALGVTLF